MWFRWRNRKRGNNSNSDSISGHNLQNLIWFHHCFCHFLLSKFWFSCVCFCLLHTKLKQKVFSSFHIIGRKDLSVKSTASKNNKIIYVMQKPSKFSFLCFRIVYIVHTHKTQIWKAVPMLRMRNETIWSTITKMIFIDFIWQLAKDVAWSLETVGIFEAWTHFNGFQNYTIDFLNGSRKNWSIFKQK